MIETEFDGGKPTPFFNILLRNRAFTVLSNTLTQTQTENCLRELRDWVLVCAYVCV